jgi:hypothetical protein
MVFITFFCRIQKSIRFGRNMISEAAAEIPCPATVFVVVVLVSVLM